MKTILVADDSLVAQLSLAHILQEAGYQVHVVENGQEALDFLRSHGVDLLISDIAMPLLNGLALLRMIRNDESLPALPIIMATGTEEQITKALTSGANLVLTKPVSSWQVLDSVSQILGVAS